MNRYSAEENWITIHTRMLTRRSEDVALVQTLRSVVFRQMLEPFLSNGTESIIEGRPKVGAEHRLQSLGFHPEEVDDL